MFKSVEEFRIKLIEVGGFVSAFKALRLPFGKAERSVLEAECVSDTRSMLLDGNVVLNYSTAILDEKDLSLLSSLVKNGDEHAKVLRGVTVWCEINAPRYWWQEMVTYRIGAECLSSESTMHIEGKGLPEDKLIEMKERLTEGKMQKRIVMLSYQTLRRIYKQRKNHRLPQWKKFCKWIETLPFADYLITVGLN